MSRLGHALEQLNKIGRDAFDDIRETGERFDLEKELATIAKVSSWQDHPDLDRPDSAARRHFAESRRRGCEAAARKAKSSVAHHRFVEVWNASSSVSDAAKKLNLSNKQASSMAHDIRRRTTIKLKSFKSSRKPAIEQDRMMEVWNNAASVAQAAKELGTTRKFAVNYAARLRRKGLNLKKFKESYDPSTYTHPVCTSGNCNRETDGKHNSCQRCLRLRREHARRLRKIS